MAPPAAPTPALAWLPENVLLVTVSVPSLRMAPPKPRPSAPVVWLAENVLLVTVSVPLL
jgi:hypothetical protein